MKFKFVGILLFLFNQAVTALAQNEETILLQFHPLFKDSILILDKPYYNKSKDDSFQIGVLRFYSSGIELLLNATPVWKEENSFHLIDASSEKTLQIQLNTPSGLDYNKIKFNIGIDSTTNVSGAMGGDLDPTKGMYWTWQNGYINFKLEGNSRSCKTRNNEFTFHLGGYQYPFNTLQTLVLDVENTGIIKVNLDAAELTSEIDLANQNHIMSPNKEAVLLSEKLFKAFSIKAK